MSCPYYWWDHDYACRKTGKAVSEDIYYKYCRNYDYSDCPIYKGESSSGGCYLTSACVESRGLPDNCTELTILRNFRDNWLKKQPGGLAEVAEYYSTAPKVVSAIDALSNRKEIWDGLYESLIRPCVQFIENGEMEKAHELYRASALYLTREFL